MSIAQDRLDRLVAELLDSYKVGLLGIVIEDGWYSGINDDILDNFNDDIDMRDLDRDISEIYQHISTCNGIGISETKDQKAITILKNAVDYYYNG